MSKKNDVMKSVKTLAVVNPEQGTILDNIVSANMRSAAAARFEVACLAKFDADHAFESLKAAARKKGGPKEEYKALAEERKALAKILRAETRAVVTGNNAGVRAGVKDFLRVKSQDEYLREKVYPVYVSAVRDGFNPSAVKSMNTAVANFFKFTLGMTAPAGTLYEAARRISPLFGVKDMSVVGFQTAHIGDNYSGLEAVTYNTFKTRLVKGLAMLACNGSLKAPSTLPTAVVQNVWDEYAEVCGCDLPGITEVAQGEFDWSTYAWVYGFNTTEA